MKSLYGCAFSLAGVAVLMSGEGMTQALLFCACVCAAAACVISDWVEGARARKE